MTAPTPSATQRVVLTIVAFLLILAQLTQLPLLLDSFRGHDADPPNAGGVIALALTVVFAFQIFRGRWLLAALWFLALYLAMGIWVIFRMPAEIGGMPFRYPFFLSKLPFLLVHLVSFIGVFSVRHTLTSQPARPEPASR